MYGSLTTRVMSLGVTLDRGTYVRGCDTDVYTAVENLSESLWLTDSELTFVSSALACRTRTPYSVPDAIAAVCTASPDGG